MIVPAATHVSAQCCGQCYESVCAYSVVLGLSRSGGRVQCPAAAEREGSWERRIVCVSGSKDESVVSARAEYLVRVIHPGLAVQAASWPHPLTSTHDAHPRPRLPQVHHARRQDIYKEYF